MSQAVHPAASSETAFPAFRVNSGDGPSLVPLDIGHASHLAVIDPDSAFWALVPREDLAETLEGRGLAAAYQTRAARFKDEMRALRFGLGLSAVYVNPTERCNLNCAYCYIPERMRRDGEHMSAERLLSALEILRGYFKERMPEGRLPQIIFHGAEPLLNKEAVFEAISAFHGVYRFGVQTNGTLLDEEGARFLMDHGAGVGLSLDGPEPKVADRTRKTWAGNGVHASVLRAMDLLAGYPGHNVICTVTRENLESLTAMVEFFHARKAPSAMLNMVRCTLPGARDIKPGDAEAARAFIPALERSHRLYLETGRKLVIANFANILAAIYAPTARRLMCDISPCGGGRVFFALAPDGGMYPCGEFVGLPGFRGGNLFTDPVDAVLASKAFSQVTGRKVEDIEPCRRCAIRHFCGSPCPAEAHEMRGGMDKTGAFCAFYGEQVRFAFRLIADGRAGDFLWDGWDAGTETLFDAATEPGLGGEARS
jgi:uncharacterized protein